jgi:hypothetical protein
MGRCVNEMDEKMLWAVLERLYKAIPAIGHHELEAKPPTYECPKLELARAMNEAAKALGRPLPYPEIVKI